MSEWWTHELLASALIMGVMGTLLTLAELWRAFFQPPVEWTRKFVHMGMGVLVSTLPWLLQSPWTVLTLNIGSASLLLLARRKGLLQSVHGVSRKSHGVLLYGVAVVLLFFLSQGQPVYYFISMLTLTVSDALAALLGKAYSKVRYSVDDHYKSLEGSIVFLLSTFLIVHIPLLLLTDLERLVCIYIALQCAIAITFIEAISFDGIDNLVIPVATFVSIFLMATHTAGFLGAQILVQLIAIALTLTLAWRYPVFSATSAVTLQLFVFGAYALGGKVWTVAPLIGLGLFLFFHRLGGCKRASEEKYKIVSVFYTFLAGGLLLLARSIGMQTAGIPDWIYQGDPLYPLYVGAIGAQGVLVLYRVIEVGNYSARYRSYAPICALVFLAMILPAFALHPNGIRSHDLLIAASIIGSAVLLHLWMLRDLPKEECPTYTFRLHAMSVIGAVILFVTPHFFLRPL